MRYTEIPIPKKNDPRFDALQKKVEVLTGRLQKERDELLQEENDKDTIIQIQVETIKNLEEIIDIKERREEQLNDQIARLDGSKQQKRQIDQLGMGLIDSGGFGAFAGMALMLGNRCTE